MKTWTREDRHTSTPALQRGPLWAAPAASAATQRLMHSPAMQPRAKRKYRQKPSGAGRPAHSARSCTSLRPPPLQQQRFKQQRHSSSRDSSSGSRSRDRSCPSPPSRTVATRTPASSSRSVSACTLYCWPMPYRRICVSSWCSCVVQRFERARRSARCKSTAARDRAAILEPSRLPGPTRTRLRALPDQLRG
jgi:hypothetical protein